MATQPTALIIRGLDIGLSLVLLVLLLPLLLGMALVIRLTMGSPVVFRQTRPGRAEVLFEIFKFRTMTDARDAHGTLLPDGQRLTALGRFLRRSSIDELPELINVLRGEMSLVGPRPLLPEYSNFYTPREKKRFSVRPGITGLAQISGRNFAGWNKKLDLDVRYVENLSLRFYFKILILTAFKVFKWRDVAVNSADAERRLDVERAGQNLNAPAH